MDSEYFCIFNFLRFNLLFLCDLILKAAGGRRKRKLSRYVRYNQDTLLEEEGKRELMRYVKANKDTLEQGMKEMGI